MIEVLMLYGALSAINTRNRFGHTPLHAAVHARHIRATRTLLQFGANPCLRFDGISVIEMAAETGHTGLMRLVGSAFSKWEEEHGQEEEEADEEEDGVGSEDDESEEEIEDESSVSDEETDEESAQNRISMNRKQEDALSNLAMYRQAIRQLR